MLCHDTRLVHQVRPTGILDARFNSFRATIEFKVTWDGHPDTVFSWEPLALVQKHMPHELYAVHVLCAIPELQ